MRLFLLMIISLLLSCQQSAKQESGAETAQRYVTKAKSAITLDGIDQESDWNQTDWLSIDQVWIGEDLQEADFSGRYKMLWSEEHIYLYAEIQDDFLRDEYQDPLVQYWDDDCLEVFVDEDASGGNHQYNHNAWAYHIALDGTVVDIGPDSVAHIYPHIKSKRRTEGTKSSWELQMSVYSDQYKDQGQNTPVQLHSGKTLGFAIAYCDNDSSKEREHFIGSEFVEGVDKNRGWIDASIFGNITLK